MLPLNNILRYPIFQTLKVDIFDRPHTFAQTYQRIHRIVAALKTYPTYFVICTDSTLLGYTLNFQQLIMHMTVGLKIPLSHLLLLLNNFLKPQLDLPQFDKSSMINRKHLPIFQYPP